MRADNYRREWERLVQETKNKSELRASTSCSGMAIYKGRLDLGELAALRL